jgi:hypothetical protein
MSLRALATEASLLGIARNSLDGSLYYGSGSTSADWVGKNAKRLPSAIL